MTCTGMTNLCKFLSTWMGSWLGTDGVPTRLSRAVMAAWLSECVLCAILRGVLFGLGLGVFICGYFVIGAVMMIASIVLTRIENACL